MKEYFHFHGALEDDRSSFSQDVSLASDMGYSKVMAKTVIDRNAHFMVGAQCSFPVQCCRLQFLPS